MSSLADRLAQIMAQKGLKAVDIAKATGIKPPVLSRYLSGKVRPSADNLIVISQLLDVTPDWLLSLPEAQGSSLQMVHSISTDKDKVIEVQGALIETLKREGERLLEENEKLRAKKWGYEVHAESTDMDLQIAKKDRYIAELIKNCDALAEEVIKLGKPNEAHKELVEVIDTQKVQMEKLMGYCEGLVEEVQRLKKKI